MVPDEFGNCQCGDNTIEAGGKCVAATTFAMVASILVVVALALVTFFYIRHKNAQNDGVWQVHPDELRLYDPVEVIGEGSFGVVLLAVRIYCDYFQIALSTMVNSYPCLTSWFIN